MGQKKLIKVGYTLIITFKRGSSTDVELFDKVGKEVLFPGFHDKTYPFGIETRSRGVTFLQDYNQCQDWNNRFFTATFFVEFLAGLYNLDKKEDVEKRHSSSEFGITKFVFTFARKPRRKTKRARF